MSTRLPPPPPFCSGILHTVAPGETLFILSTRFGTPLATIVAANPQITNPNLIFPGQRICIPLPPAPQECSNFFYTVVPGDTLDIISQRFGVRVADIVTANPQIVNPDLIFAGQVICIPIPPPPAIECTGFLYQVGPGETLQSIAQLFNVTVQQIFAANPPIINPNIIYPNQIICIPGR